MNGTERQEQILAAMRLSGSISVNELIEMLPASPATVRRDITALAANGKIRKDRGRIFLEGNPQVPAFELRGEMYGDEKKRIAQAAAALVRDGDTIIIDAGTTTQALANALGPPAALCDHQFHPRSLYLQRYRRPCVLLRRDAGGHGRGGQ